jgi:hypothetical protein
LANEKLLYKTTVAALTAELKNLANTTDMFLAKV